MSLWAVQSTHSGRRRCEGRASCLGQINKYSKSLFSAGSFTPGGPAVPIVRGRGIEEEMGFSLFFAPKLSLNAEPLIVILVFHCGLT